MEREREERKNICKSFMFLFVCLRRFMKSVYCFKGEMPLKRSWADEAGEHETKHDDNRTPPCFNFCQRESIFQKIPFLVRFDIQSRGDNLLDIFAR